MTVPVHRNGGPTPGTFGYKGGWGYQEDPDTGFRLLGHRYYDAATGRFLTRDPIKDGRNWYAYGGGTGSPIHGADPTGLWFDDANDFFAGWGDTLTPTGVIPAAFGHSSYTGMWRRLIGADDTVDKGSGWYVGGLLVGAAHSALLGRGSIPYIDQFVKGGMQLRGKRITIFVYQVKRNGLLGIKVVNNNGNKQIVRAEIQQWRDIKGQVQPWWKWPHYHLGEKDKLHRPWDGGFR